MADPASAGDQILRLTRENEQLRLRVAQLQGEVWDLGGRLARALMAPDPDPAPSIARIAGPAIPRGDNDRAARGIPTCPEESHQ